MSKAVLPCLRAPGRIINESSVGARSKLKYFDPLFLKNCRGKNNKMLLPLN